MKGNTPNPGAAHPSPATEPEPKGWMGNAQVPRSSQVAFSMLSL